MFYQPHNSTYPVPIANPYHLKRIRIQDMIVIADPDVDKTLIRIRIRAKKNSVPGKSLTFDQKARLISHTFSVYITKLSLFSNNHINLE